MLSCTACSSITPYEFLYEKSSCLIKRCTKCGLGYAESSGFNPEKYYTKDYFDGGHSDGYSDYVGSEHVLRNEFSRIVNVLKRYCPPQGRILEIGCAYGFFLKEACQYFEVHGIELAEDAVAACHQQGLVNVHHGVADEARLSQIGMIDAIVMLDVIEHLPDPVKTLRLCNKILKPGGVILITTGDFGSPVARLAGQHWRLMTPPQHLWYFSRQSFTSVARALNLKMMSCVHPWKLVPISLVLFQISRMLGRNKKTSSNSLLSRIGIPVNLFDAMRVVLRKPSLRD